MPAPNNTPVPPPRPGPARDVDGLIRDLQRINLSQCMDQLTSDIHQLSSMEHQLTTWRGLYVRCPDPEPEDLGLEPADKKSSSGYSTESASPPGSRNFSGDADGDTAVNGHELNGQPVHERGINGRVVSGNGLDGARHPDQVRDCGTLTTSLPPPPSVALMSNPVAGAVRRDRPLRQRTDGENRPENGHREATKAGCVPPTPQTAPLDLRRRPGLLQSSVAHSTEQRRVTPLLASAAFCPPAASTPTLATKQPRSPKTLRFAAAHELIPPESSSRRQVAAGAPRPGILRGGGQQTVREPCERPAAPGWRSSPSPGRTEAGHPAPDGPAPADSAERFSRVVSALSRLEAELSSAQRRPPQRTYGTSQFVRQPPRRQLSFTQLPPAPLDPLVLVSTATDSEDSDDSDDGWPAAASDAAWPGTAPSDGADDGFVRSRRARLPGRLSSQAAPRRRQLSWLLSCASRRRPPSPSSAYLSPPPSEPSSPAAAGAYGCNLCKARFREHSMLVAHVHERHVRVQMRPKYSCGLCPARFYASKFLAKHCAYHHNSMGDKRTPQCLKSHRAQ